MELQQSCTKPSIPIDKEDSSYHNLVPINNKPYNTVQYNQIFLTARHGSKRETRQPIPHFEASYMGGYCHSSDVIMGTMASQITSLTMVYSTVYSGADQRKHQSSAPLAFVRGIHRWPVNSPHKWPVTRTMFPFDDVIMVSFGGKNACNVLRFYCALKTGVQWMPGQRN